MNGIARLKYELTYCDSAVHRFNHYTTRTPPPALFSPTTKQAFLVAIVGRGSDHQAANICWFIQSLNIGRPSKSDGVQKRPDIFFSLKKQRWKEKQSLQCAQNFTKAYFYKKKKIQTKHQKLFSKMLSVFNFHLKKKTAQGYFAKN